MTDPIRSRDEIRAEQQHVRAEARAAQERTRTEALTELGLTAADAALFTVIYYGFTIPPSDLPGVARREDYNPSGAVTEAECRSALTDCLVRGWLQVIDEPARRRIASELRRGGVLGPVYGLPDAGGVDFTDSGAGLWRRLTERCWPAKGFSNYTDVVHEKTARYFRTEMAAVAAIEEIRGADDVVAVTGPTALGPWRAQWWRRFPEGYRIDIEERRQWQGGSSGGGETCYFDRSAQRADPNRLQHVLDRHNVTLAEWLLLQSMESGCFRDSAANLARDAAESGNRYLGVTISDEQCREGLEACLRYGWLRATDQRATAEVHTLLDADPAHLALPRTAENRPQECCYTFDPTRPGKLIPKPFPATYWLGKIDFSPAGATLYRTISAEWLGLDWEDALRVSRGYQWEEHCYCVAEEGFEGVTEEHVAKGSRVLARRVVPIGPWCARWWDRFPTGLRFELELGEP
ncbi:hypothetical protein [Fimbriiglobus ruber]|uniref:hypothetical protein n=1 Tax=Fimbriiglobus ruber TaxID=1908690 RepID=UPI000B4A8ACA|nr:hypothetical protein [Fimbriiglobus ruber]